MQWQVQRFSELTTHQLYQILRLRQQVFVVEQECIYQDLDDNDQIAQHLSGWYTDDSGEQRLGAYLRIFAPGLFYPEVSLGRVLTAQSSRGDGTGRALMEQAITAINNDYPQWGIRISAQKYLERFYGSLGFVICGEAYDEDGIEHIEMFRSAS